MTLTVRPTANLDDIKAVLSHPAIWDAITVDGTLPPHEFNWSAYEKFLVICGYADGAPVAICVLHGFLDGDQGHMHVLPEYRKEYALKFGQEAMKYVQFPLYAEVPDAFQNVQRYVESLGMIPVGVIDSAYTKNGARQKVTRYARYQ